MAKKICSLKTGHKREIVSNVERILNGRTWGMVWVNMAAKLRVLCWVHCGGTAVGATDDVLPALSGLQLKFPLNKIEFALNITEFALNKI
jgi:hypothetical protein